MISKSNLVGQNENMEVKNMDGVFEAAEEAFSSHRREIEKLETKINLSRGKLQHIEQRVEHKYKEIKKQYDELPDVPSSMTRSSILTAKLEMLAYVLGLLEKDLPDSK